MRTGRTRVEARKLQQIAPWEHRKQVDMLLAAAQGVQAALARIYNETGETPLPSEVEAALVDAIRACGGRLSDG